MNDELFTFEQLMQIMDKFSDVNIDEFKYENESSKLLLKKNEKGTTNVNTGSGSVVNLNTETSSRPVMNKEISVDIDTKYSESDDNKEEINVYTVKSPIVGTFYSSKEEGGMPLVKVGDTVKKDSIVAIIEAMKLMNEITAGADGVVTEIFVENGELVEYGQEIMKIAL